MKESTFAAANFYFWFMVWVIGVYLLTSKPEMDIRIGTVILAVGMFFWGYFTRELLEFEIKQRRRNR